MFLHRFAHRFFAVALVALIPAAASAFDMSRARNYPSPDMFRPKMEGVTITPTPGNNLGLILNQSFAGSKASSVSGNYLSLSDSAVTNPDGASIFWNMDHTILGGVTGHRNSFQLNTHFNGRSSGDTRNPYYQTFGPTMDIHSGDGGTAPDANGPIYSTGRGAFFVTNPVLKATNAPNLQELSVQENNISCDATCSVAYKSSFAIVPLATDKTQGRQVDDLITLSSQPGAVGARNIINISSSHGAMPVNSGSTMIRADPATISTGIEFGNLTILGNAWSSPGMAITGYGNITFQAGRAALFDLGAGIAPGTHGAQLQGVNGTLYIDNWDAGISVRAPLTLTKALIEAQSAPPATSTSPCTTGQRTWDQFYEYRCVLPNIWKRTPLSGW